MNVISLDAIVKNILIKRNYSLHWYLDFLIPAKDCLRELSFDLPMNTVQYKLLPRNSNGAIEIPNDYVDWTGLYYRAGEFLRPLVEDDSLSLVPNYDSEFSIQPYANGVATDTTNPSLFYLGNAAPYWLSVNWNAFGENLGRQYGGVPSYNDTFRVNKARNEIKINENLGISDIVLEYIGNGLDSDSATHINAYAQSAIEAFAMWQFYAHNRTYSQSQASEKKMEYAIEREVLAARLSDITIDRLKRIVQSNSISIKY